MEVAFHSCDSNSGTVAIAAGRDAPGLTLGRGVNRTRSRNGNGRQIIVRDRADRYLFENVAAGGRAKDDGVSGLDQCTSRRDLTEVITLDIGG